MASATRGAAPVPTDAPDTQQGGSARNSRAEPEDWPSLLRHCEEHDITARAMDLEHESLEAALAAIDAANKSPGWKKAHRNKLRKQLQRAVAAAEAMAVDAAGSSSSSSTAPPPLPPAPLPSPPALAQDAMKQLS